VRLVSKGNVQALGTVTPKKMAVSTVADNSWLHSLSLSLVAKIQTAPMGRLVNSGARRVFEAHP